MAERTARAASACCAARISARTVARPGLHRSTSNQPTRAIAEYLDLAQLPHRLRWHERPSCCCRIPPFQGKWPPNYSVATVNPVNCTPVFTIKTPGPAVLTFPTETPLPQRSCRYPIPGLRRLKASKARPRPGCVAGRLPADPGIKPVSSARVLRPESHHTEDDPHRLGCLIIFG